MSLLGSVGFGRRGCFLFVANDLLQKAIDLGFWNEDALASREASYIAGIELPVSPCCRLAEQCSEFLRGKSCPSIQEGLSASSYDVVIDFVVSGFAWHGTSLRMHAVLPTFDIRLRIRKATCANSTAAACDGSEG